MIKQKIMKTVYRFLLVALLAMAATSCLYEDKGNYDYHAINDITIGGIASGQEYPVVSFVDTLRIKPQITCAQSTDESTLEYQWNVLITAKDINSVPMPCGGFARLSPGLLRTSPGRYGYRFI